MDHFIVNARGQRVNLQAISPFQLNRIALAVEAEFRARGEPLTCPTYTTDLPGGEHQTFPHNASTLTTDEERAAYAAYQDATTRLTNESWTRRQRYLILHGVVPDVSEPPVAWLEEQTWLGIPLASDPRERLLDYIYAELLIEPSGVQAAINRIIELAYAPSVPAEDVAAAEAVFRRKMGESTTGGTEAAPELLAVPAPAGGMPGGESLGADARPVSGAQRRRAKRDAGD
jgi:hypothetical protein